MKKPFILAFAAILLSSFLFSACSNAYAPSDETEKKYEEFTVVKTEEEENFRIYCRLYLPDGVDCEEEQLPAVILSHSAAMTADSMNLYASGFAQRGFAAVCFDFCGGSPDSRSDGRETDMTIFTEKEDLKTVLSYVQSLGYIDPNKIYLFGTSQGGLVTALVANDLPDRIAGLILLYPAFNIPELVQNYFSADGSAPITDAQSGYTPRGVGFGFPFPSAGDAFQESLKDFDAYANIGNFKGDVLILHGSNDFMVNSSYSVRAKEVYGDRCTLYIIDGAGHGFNRENYGTFFGDFDQIVWRYVDEFLLGHELVIV